jgi:valyl-tRNA synthetase
VIVATQAIRNWREQVAVKPGVSLAARIEAVGYEGDGGALLGRIARLQLGGDGEAVAQIAIPGGTLAILDGVDLGAHAQRQQRERARLVAEIERLRAKLSNDAFVNNAPAPVVERERAKLARLEAELADLG